MMPDRTIAPPFFPPDKFQLPQADVISYANGSSLVLLNIGDQPVVSVGFNFRAGTWFESCIGQAFFTAKMLTEGTKSYSSAELAAKLDFYGAFTGIQPGFDYSRLDLHLPTRQLDKVMDVVEEMLFEPTFTQRELEVMKQIQQNQLQVNLQKNNYLASREFRNALYPSHPYGHSPTNETIAAINPEALVEFFMSNMYGRFDVFIHGKFGNDVSARFDGLMKTRMKLMHEFPALPIPETAASDCHFEKPDSLQSAIYLGNRCITKKHPDYPAVLLLNEVFGGYFGSRLMQNIREDKGYTYGIHSHMAHLKNDSYFVIGTEVKSDKKEATLSEIRLEIDRIKNELISGAELESAKNHLKGSILNSLTSPAAVADKLKNIRMYHLPDDYYSRLFDGIDAATPQALLELANTVLFDRPLTCVSVG